MRNSRAKEIRKLAAFIAMKDAPTSPEITREVTTKEITLIPGDEPTKVQFVTAVSEWPANSVRGIYKKLKAMYKYLN